MTDYNDGKWHGWNGGECPVCPSSEIEGVYRNASAEGLRGVVSGKARQFCWGNESLTLVAFRVVKAYREPREWWLRLDEGGSITGTDEATAAPPPNWNLARTIKVREVIE